MLVKIEARILIFPGTDFHFPSTSVPPGTFFKALLLAVLALPTDDNRHDNRRTLQHKWVIYTVHVCLSQ